MLLLFQTVHQPPKDTVFKVKEFCLQKTMPLTFPFMLFWHWSNSVCLPGSSMHGSFKYTTIFVTRKKTFRTQAVSKCHYKYIIPCCLASRELNTVSLKASLVTPFLVTGNSPSSDPWGHCLCWLSSSSPPLQAEFLLLGLRSLPQLSHNYPAPSVLCRLGASHTDGLILTSFWPSVIFFKHRSFF